MLFIPTKLNGTTDGDVKVVTTSNVPKGEIVWRFNSLTTQVFWKKHFISQLDKLPAPSINEYLKYSYLKDGNVYYRVDNLKFVSHSKEPNLAFIESNFISTIKDIKKGEVLNINFHISYDRNTTILQELLKMNKGKKDILSLLKKEFSLNKMPMNAFKVDEI